MSNLKGSAVLWAYLSPYTIAEGIARGGGGGGLSSWQTYSVDRTWEILTLFDQTSAGKYTEIYHIIAICIHQQQ